MTFTSVAVAVRTVLTFKVKIPNLTAKAPDERLNVPLNPLTSVPPFAAEIGSFGSGAMLPLRTELPGNKVAETAVMVKVELPEVEMAPVALLMEMLLSVTEGDVTSRMFATLISDTVRDALVMVVVPAAMVMSRLPVAVNSVLLLVPTVNVKSLAPV